MSIAVRKLQLMDDPLDVEWESFECETCGRVFKSIRAAQSCCRD